MTNAAAVSVGSLDKFSFIWLCLNIAETKDWQNTACPFLFYQRIPSCTDYISITQHSSNLKTDNM